MTKQKSVTRQSSISILINTLRTHHSCGKSLWIFVAVLLVLSILAGANFEQPKTLYVAGQVVEHDVVADRDIMVEDAKATATRRKEIILMQPPVYDLNAEAYTQFQDRIIGILKSLNNSGDFMFEADPAIKRLIEEITLPVAEEILPELAPMPVQDYILKNLLPKIRESLADGMVSDVRSARVGRSGIVVRNLENNSEVLRPDVSIIPDVQSFLASLSAQIRTVPEFNPHTRRALNILLSATVPASLTLNLEASKKRAEEAAATVESVYYHIKKGEIIVRKGERATSEQQVKLQTLYRRVADSISWDIVGGTFFCSIILSIGFFVSPSGRPGTPLQSKDIISISLLLILCGLGAKGLYILCMRLDNISLLNSFSIVFPVSGVIGLTAMVFAARRYCTMGLLVSFLCVIMLRAEYTLFIYYFLGGMLATWLVTNAQSRQDVVWSIIPLTIGLLCIWCSVALLSGTNLDAWPGRMISVVINGILSLVFLFAVSPVLEMAFGYSTRFRLMELMSLEQPLMQELMVTIPGTYHHSLVVANMVEAGAKAIGANSLLCKVAALYHDVGKLSYPEYFIENQFGGQNKHDKLAPSMSALILLAHVKKGTELAEQYKLGQEISDIIKQHHGTRIMSFFYKKAQNLGEKPEASEFSYPGPKPQTREAAILMLADSVEASSRTLTDPTPARIRNHIDTIIKGIFSEGQLDESELTFKDLHFLSENFQRILNGIFHQRIAYPEDNNVAVNGARSA